jgi:hypothetical protein
MLASGTRVRGFIPGWSRRIFLGDIKILSLSSFGGEVKPSVSCRSFAACKRSVRLPWKSLLYAKLNRPFSSPILPSLANRGLSRSLDAERLWRWRGELNQGVHNRPSCGRSASGLQSPGSAPIKKKEELLASWCLSVSAWINSAPITQIFETFGIWLFFENVLTEFKFVWSLARITGILHEDRCVCTTISPWTVRSRNVSEKSCVQNRNTIFGSVTFSRKIVPFMWYCGKLW